MENKLDVSVTSDETKENADEKENNKNNTVLDGTAEGTANSADTDKSSEKPVNIIDRPIDEWSMCYENTPEEDQMEKELEAKLKKERKEALRTLMKTPKYKSRKSQRNAFILKVTALAMILSFAFGICGAYLYTHYIGGAITIQRGNVTVNVVEKKDPPTLEDYSPTSIPAVVSKTEDSVVAITTNTIINNPIMGQYVQEGAGSGVIISEDGYIITNTHVIGDATSIIVRLHNDKEFTATIIGADVTTDIAVIKIEVTGLTPITFGNSDNIVIGQTVVAIGNPLGELGGTVTSGIISAKDRELTINNQNMNLLQFSAAVNPGNSGGGLFNLDSELIGIVNAKNSSAGIEGLGFAIPSNDALDIATQLIENGKVTGRPQLGVSVVEILNTSDIYNYVSEPIYPFLDTVGIYVVDATTPHLFLGDKIIAIDGQSINTYDDLKNIINKKQVGDVVSVTISRSKQMLTLDIELSEKS